MLFVEDGWAVDHHDVEMVDKAGTLLSRRRLPEGVRRPRRPDAGAAGARWTRTRPLGYPDQDPRPYRRCSPQ